MNSVGVEIIVAINRGKLCRDEAHRLAVTRIYEDMSDRLLAGPVEDDEIESILVQAEHRYLLVVTSFPNLRMHPLAFRWHAAASLPPAIGDLFYLKERKGSVMKFMKPSLRKLKRAA